MKYKIVFNFSASRVGGGYKRLYEYSKYFNEKGGMYFIIHPSCISLKDEFANNFYLINSQNYLQRLFMDFRYLRNFIKSINEIDVYYSYGIPFDKKFAKINILHLSNVLPFEFLKFANGFLQKTKMFFLSMLLKNTFKYADLISAESNSSFKYVNKKWENKYFISPNGNDDEISLNNKNKAYDDTAVIVGTYNYKNIDDSLIIYNYLKNNSCKNLNLLIIGDNKYLSQKIKVNKDIIFLGLLPRNKVVELLSNSKYYISTTLLENSFNAAAEGIFLSNESFISDIGPHMELVNNFKYERVEIGTNNCKILHINNSDLNTNYLKNWDTIITELILMIEKNIFYEKK